MAVNPFDMQGKKMGWCPGCGNYKLLDALKEALHQLVIDRRNLVIVSGIGQGAKTPQYVNAHMFNGLHGRALPVAMGVKLSNRNLVVIAESGDGCMYGEGGNHFLHAIRRNYDITVIVHDNMVYGLTKGQASPTSRMGMKTSLQINGVMLEPFNPIAVALALDAPFVARANVGDGKQTSEIIKQAIAFKGFAVVDIFQPCVIFNKENTYQWFKDNTYYLPGDYDPSDRKLAFEKAIETEKFPLGVIYRQIGRELYEDMLGITHIPAYEHGVSQEAFEMMLESYK
ncbi:thiamine pyrophosphate-dependent enzyme [Prosthecochloris sp. SCSIO W1101]|uniref:thiamine pyrophosphate-dependent enzyme n=1 Tax=Prosthecochloris sp. SCSIO W1101 TaxID=2992242 RepID=UPI00223E4E56|nr:thiamine pyrophosphate-dependent enzyme [Prosthecochloris sp. SCSIO W1101]UZJ40385.1 thiamine pyrophosphate-dependent enzyme [Prosthecochloris sp. SCSIO W1101]